VTVWTGAVRTGGGQTSAVPTSGVRIRAARARGVGAGGMLVAGMLALAGCGGPATGPAPSAPRSDAPGTASGTATGPALAVSLADASGTNWAVVEMGGAAAQEENFWQVLVRPPGSAGWRLATPAGVADNGGLVVASTGAGSLLAGFRPSQDLTFSPLTATTDAGTRWSGADPVSPGLNDVPGALAAGPDGRLLALTDDGGVRLSTGPGGRWSVLTTSRRLAATPAGRACGLTAVTAAAFAPDGAPLLGGVCTRPGVAGVFALRDGTWQAAGLDLSGSSGRASGAGADGATGTSPPAAGRSGGASRVLSLGDWAGRVTALLAVGGGPGADRTVADRTAADRTAADGTAADGTGGSGGPGIVAAWWSGGRWTLSPVLRTSARVRSADLWAGGAAGLVLAGREGVTIAGPGSAWATLPPLPAGTATLAPGPDGRPEALAAVGSSLAVWLAGTAGSGRVGSGTSSSGTSSSGTSSSGTGDSGAGDSGAGSSDAAGSGTAGWRRAQVIRVPIAYGSSG
jgi:hypothetical protein